MRLVHHYEIGLRYLAPCQGLNGANLDRLIGISQLVLTLHHTYLDDPVTPEALDRLCDETDRRNRKDHPSALPQSRVDHCRRRCRLS